jgi:HEPN domain-containing protein
MYPQNLFHEYLMIVRKKEENFSSADLELLDCAKDLDRHYIPSRYPSTAMPVAPSKLYTERVAHDAVSCSWRILDFAQKILES